MRLILILLFLFFPLGEVVRLSLTNTVALTGNDITIFFFVCYGCFMFWKKKGFLQKKDIPFLLLPTVFFVSLVVNSARYAPLEVFIAFLYLFRFGMYMVLYFIIRQIGIKEKIYCIYLMVASGAGVVFLGFVQYFLYPDLRNLYYAGWDEHLYRMFSTFLDPNFAGAFFVMYFLFLVGLFVKEIVIARREVTRQSSNRFPRSVFTSLGMTRRSLYGFLLFITLGAILLTYSRSAYLMLLVSGSVFVFMTVSSRLARTIIISLGLLTIFVAIVVLSKLPKSEGTNLLRTTSGFARVAVFDNAITLFKENPVFGVGFNAYRYAQKQHGFLLETTKENHSGAGADNSFLFVLATTGVVGFVAYVYFWYTVLMEILKRVQHDNKRFWTNAVRQNDVILGRSEATTPESSHVYIMRSVVLATIAGLFVNAFFINSLFYPFLLEFLFVELAIITVTD